MEWIAENAKDEKLLGLLDLELLSQEIVAHGDGIAELVGQHNTALTTLVERHERLVEDRKRLVDFTDWTSKTLDDVLAERSRLARETWDWLQAIRCALSQREALLRKAEDAIAHIFTDLHERREKTIEALRKSNSKLHREMAQANPTRGEWHFTEFLDNDTAVVAIDQEYAKLKSDIDWVVSARRRAAGNMSDILRRQEEVFKHVLN